jgi:hypothetical protein
MTTPTTRLLLSHRAQLIDWLRRSDPGTCSENADRHRRARGVWSARLDAPPSVVMPTPAPVILAATALPATRVPIAAPSTICASSAPWSRMMRPRGESIPAVSRAVLQRGVRQSLALALAAANRALVA